MLDDYTFQHDVQFSDTHQEFVCISLEGFKATSELSHALIGLELGVEDLVAQVGLARVGGGGGAGLECSPGLLSSLVDDGGVEPRGDVEGDEGDGLGLLLSSGVSIAKDCRPEKTVLEDALDATAPVGVVAVGEDRALHVEFRHDGRVGVGD